MYEIVHEGDKWVLYVDHKYAGDFSTFEEGVAEIERLKNEE